MKLTTRKQRQAVAPVLATLLMIAVAVAMSVIIFMWSQGFLSQTSSATGGQQGAQNQAAQSSITIELASFVPCPPGGPCVSGTNPKITLVVRNVGAVAVTLGSITVTGSSSNTGFTGSLVTSAVATTGGLTSADAGCATASYNNLELATAATMTKGGSSTITLGPPTAVCSGTGRIFSGDVINIKVTTSVGTFGQAQFTVP